MEELRAMKTKSKTSKRPRLTVATSRHPEPGKSSTSPAARSRRTVRKRRGSARAQRGRSKVEKLQLDIPASFLADGSRFATLREVIDPSVPTRPLDRLSQHELASLVVHRLENDDKEFMIRMLGVPGIIDKARAIGEVKALSHIGVHLIDIERRFIRMLIERG
jgi:hypothetical protein